MCPDGEQTQCVCEPRRASVNECSDGEQTPRVCESRVVSDSERAGGFNHVTPGVTGNGF